MWHGKYSTLKKEIVIVKHPLSLFKKPFQSKRNHPETGPTKIAFPRQTDYLGPCPSAPSSIHPQGIYMYRPFAFKLF